MPNGTEFQLERELWMWRGFAILILLILTVTSVITFVVDRNQHAMDNKERAAAWQQLKDRTEGNRNMISKNHEAILLVDEHLRQCVQCHIHENIKWEKPK